MSYKYVATIPFAGNTTVLLASTVFMMIPLLLPLWRLKIIGQIRCYMGKDLKNDPKFLKKLFGKKIFKDKISKKYTRPWSAVRDLKRKILNTAHTRILNQPRLRVITKHIAPFKHPIRSSHRATPLWYVKGGWLFFARSSFPPPPGRPPVLLRW